MDAISEAIRYVGVDDTGRPTFENQYPLPAGMSYNSYVVAGTRRTAILDTVEADRGDEWMANLEASLEGRQPDYLVTLHMEPDHSANIVRALVKWPGLKVVAGRQALQMLPQFFPGVDFDGRTYEVKEGDTLDLGDHTLRFFAAPMVHWPEVMVVFDEEDRVLFSADAFGKFGAVGLGGGWDDEARRYYANIVGKYGNQVQSLLRKLSKLSVDIIAPLHGPVLKSDIGHYLGLYDKWSRYEPECRGVMVAYASVYGGTADAALALAGMLRASGNEVVAVDLTATDVSEAVSLAFKYDSMVLCSVTYDAGLFPAMHRFLHHLQTKGLRRRCVGLVENGTWAPVAARKMAEMLGEMTEMTVVGDPVTIRSRLSDNSLRALRDLATLFDS